jgi:hypothetical protein
MIDLSHLSDAELEQELLRVADEEAQAETASA